MSDFIKEALEEAQEKSKLPKKAEKELLDQILYEGLENREEESEK